MAQTRTPSVGDIPPTDYIARAKDILRGLYPSLVGSKVALVIHDRRPWSFPGVTNLFSMHFFTEYGEKEDSQGNPCHCEKLVLWASFDFASLDNDKELTRLNLDAPLTDAHREGFKKLVLEHSDWSDLQFVQALKKGGAKYVLGDKDQLLHALPLALLKPYIGELTVKSAEWVVDRPRGGDPHELHEQPDCYWRIEGRSRLSSGATKEYLLVVEPFEGSLSSIMQTPD